LLSRLGGSSSGVRRAGAAADLAGARRKRTLDWIEGAEDLPVGDGFATSNADGTAAGADYKSDEGKDGYHPVRALVFLRDWIDAKLAGRGVP